MSFVIIYFEFVQGEKFSYHCVLLRELLCKLYWVTSYSCIGAVISIAANATTFLAL